MKAGRTVAQEMLDALDEPQMNVYLDAQNNRVKLLLMQWQNRGSDDLCKQSRAELIWSSALSGNDDPAVGKRQEPRSATVIRGKLSN